MSSVERLPERWSRPVGLSIRTASLPLSQGRRSLVPGRMVTMLVFLAVALTGRRANSDEVGPTSGTVSFTDTVSTSEYYRKHGLWLVPATMDNQPALVLFGTGSNVVCDIFQNAGALEVVAVNKYFANADHGLEKGDRVLKLNGTDTKLVSLADLQEIISKAGTTVSLEMQRGERRFSVDLKLELPYQWPPKWESERVTFDQDFEGSLK